MRKFLLVLFLSVSFTKLAAQDHEKVADEICLAFKKIKTTDSERLYEEKSVLKTQIISNNIESLPVKTLEKQKNVLNFINVFNYKIERNLQQNCEFKVEYNPYTFLPLTNVVDFDEAFNKEQFENLKTKIEKIRVDKNLDVLVLEVDDFYPFQDITDYSFEILNNWNRNVGLEATNGKLIIVFSKELREIRISTNATAKQFLDDQFIQKTIDSYIVPNFKNADYYKGILESLNQIDQKL